MTEPEQKSAGDAGVPAGARRIEQACPHCGAPSKARTSRTLSALYRERTYQCTNVDCGHTFIVGMEVVRTISPSATPNPDVHIPLSSSARAGCRVALERH